MSNEKRDRELGMDQPIRRRDFLNGMSLAIGASLAAPSALWTAMLSASDQAYAPEKAAAYYPPAKKGDAREPRWVVGSCVWAEGR